LSSRLDTRLSEAVTTQSTQLQQATASLNNKLVQTNATLTQQFETYTTEHAQLVETAVSPLRTELQTHAAQHTEHVATLQQHAKQSETRDGAVASLQQQFQRLRELQQQTKTKTDAAETLRLQLQEQVAVSQTALEAHVAAVSEQNTRISDSLLQNQDQLAAVAVAVAGLRQEAESRTELQSSQLTEAITAVRHELQTQALSTTKAGDATTTRLSDLQLQTTTQQVHATRVGSSNRAP
jgi:hypothetical protein